MQAMTTTLDNESVPKNLLGRDILFFDGECILCHNAVKFLLDADYDKHFLLATQQGQTGKLILERHGVRVADLSTVYLVTNCGTDKEKLLVRSSASLYALSQFPKYAWLSRILSIFPRFLLDIGYKIIATNRYKMFGKTNDACAMLPPEDRARILP